MWAQLPDKNKDYALLFTAEEIETAKQRGLENLEDLPALGTVSVLGEFDDEESEDENPDKE